MNEYEVMLRVATEGKKTFTVEDFRAAGMHDNLSKNAIGAIFKNLSASKIIKAVGIARTTHPAAKHRWVFKWKWVET